MGNRSANKIDLSKHAFGLIEDHRRGACYVIVNRINNKLDEQKQRTPEFESKESNTDSTSKK
jgi:formylmethanofuran dehydrogenase subunit E